MVTRGCMYGLMAAWMWLVASCDVKRPDTVLSDARMEALLYDYHIAKAMGEEVPYNEAYKRALYLEDVFEKHGVSQADFDSSMVWFVRNPEVLNKVYERVNKRLKATKEEIAQQVAMRDEVPKESVSGDTVDVWAWQRMYQLAGTPLNNQLAFALQADTTFHHRDKLEWTVRFRFLKGRRSPVKAPLMALQVVYEKDTVVCRWQKLSSSVTRTLSVKADTLGKIKTVRGFVYYPQQDDAEQLLLLDDISLMRYHALDTLPDIATDTLRKEKSLRKPDAAPLRELPADNGRLLDKELPVVEEMLPDTVSSQPFKSRSRPRPVKDAGPAIKGRSGRR